jgi:AcrR family transcriptional regulator
MRSMMSRVPSHRRQGPQRGVGEQAKDGLSTLRRPSLGEEAHERARTRIVQGAAAVLALRGIDATVEEVAEAAGVSRRTVFRYFANYDELLAAGIVEIGLVIDARMPGPPAAGADVRDWLTEYTTSLHELLRQVIGRAFWDIHIGQPDVPQELNEAMTALTARRRRYADERATAAWRALGGKGAVPPWVIEAFAIQCSAFATNAMAMYDIEKAGHLTAQILWAVLSAALTEQRQVTAKAR